MPLETDVDKSDANNANNGQSKPRSCCYFDFAAISSSSAQVNQNSVQTTFALLERLKIAQYQFSILGLINRTNRVKVLGRMVPKVGSGAPLTRFLLLPLFCFSPHPSLSFSLCLFLLLLPLLRGADALENGPDRDGMQLLDFPIVDPSQPLDCWAED